MQWQREKVSASTAK